MIKVIFPTTKELVSADFTSKILLFATGDNSHYLDFKHLTKPFVKGRKFLFN
jgi:hypothetical protein